MAATAGPRPRSNDLGSTDQNLHGNSALTREKGVKEEYVSWVYTVGLPVAMPGNLLRLVASLCTIP